MTGCACKAAPQCHADFEQMLALAGCLRLFPSLHKALAGQPGTERPADCLSQRDIYKKKSCLNGLTETRTRDSSLMRAVR